MPINRKTVLVHVAREVVVEYEYSPPHEGQRDRFGDKIEPDYDGDIDVIVSIRDVKTGEIYKESEVLDFSEMEKRLPVWE